MGLERQALESAECSGNRKDAKMLRRAISMLLIVVVATPLLRVEASTLGATGAGGPRTEKVKAGIASLGTGPDARVQIKLKNKTRLTGYVSEIADDYFVIADAASGQMTTVPYPDVTQVQGNNLTTRTKVIIAASIIAGVIITLYLVRGAFCDGC